MKYLNFCCRIMYTYIVTIYASSVIFMQEIVQFTPIKYILEDFENASPRLNPLFY